MKLPAILIVFISILAGCQCVWTSSNLSAEAKSQLDNGLKDTQKRMDLLAGDLANANTDGYRGYSLVPFTPGRYPRSFLCGSAIRTGGDLDLYIQGDGFFKIKLLGGGVVYTRSGAFVPDKDGNFILYLGQGFKLDPPINIPRGSSNISVGTDGDVTFVPPGNSASPVSGGKIQLASFPAPAYLETRDGVLFQATDDSGPERLGNPGENGMGTLQQGFLEGSNVDATATSILLSDLKRHWEQMYRARMQ